MTDQEHISPFFGLPLELREQVYRDVLASPSSAPAILSTCREFNTEALKFLYQRPLHFRSQCRLLKWLHSTPHHLLTQVTDISLRIQDVDLKSILVSEDTVDSARDPNQLQTWQLYQAELDELRQAFCKLPSIKAFGIRASPNQQSFLYRDFITAVLDLLVASFSDLLEMRLEGDLHHQDMTFLSRLQSLSSFTFDGFSASTPTETASILASLTSLRSLSLTSQYAILTPITRRHSAFTAKRQSFTGEVARTMSRLASFSVTEMFPTATPTLFFTSEILTSLHDHSTLNSLSVRLSHTPDTEALKALENFLERSRIKRLELDWPDLHPFVLEEFKLLTDNLNYLRVRARTEAYAFDILWSIAETRGAGELQGLRKVVLIRPFLTHEGVASKVCDRKDSGTQAFDRLLHQVG
ncbi:hypothetical protein EK21DRAFT_103439 [Setomelanomma holmii]|uniref:Uncharacterized protein n=1 Tax=Setomelanomma holmii TaxID=210430 RepID=A0A9P4H1L0_9PLEO|nr:hypothetical protein EK21DRAFT_103439 [Setomelanomma holmii]